MWLFQSKIEQLARERVDTALSDWKASNDRDTILANRHRVLAARNHLHETCQQTAAAREQMQHQTLPLPDLPLRVRAVLGQTLTHRVVLTVNTSGGVVVRDLRILMTTWIMDR